MIRRSFSFIAMGLLFAAGATLAPAQERTVGLLLNDERASEGYTLFSPFFDTNTYLIDINGQLVHTWERGIRPNGSTYLLPHGHLLLGDQTPHPHPSPAIEPGGIGGFKEIAWDGTVIWDYVYADSLNRTHHDMARLPNGNVVIITYEYKNFEEIIAAGRDSTTLPPGDVLWPDALIEVRPILPDSAEVVWEWHAWDHLIQDIDSTKANYGVVEDHPELIDLNYLYVRNVADFLHINAVNYNAELDQLIMSTPHFNELWVIDHSTTIKEAAGHTGGRYGKGGDLLYRWGNPAAYRAGTADDQHLFFNHDAQWIEPGLPGEKNVLIYDNGRFRPGEAGQPDFSSIFELKLPLDENSNYMTEVDGSFTPAEIVWQYSDPGAFYSDIMSGMSRMPNGNTLILEGITGRIFEVTPEGEKVWEYINPVAMGGALAQGDALPSLQNPPHRLETMMFRVYRYPPDYAGLQGKDLSPKGTLELPGPTAIEGIDDVPTNFVLAQNYPNPFNPKTLISFGVPRPSKVTLAVYTMLGQRVITLADGHYEPGRHDVHFDATGFSSGVYFYRLEAEGVTTTKTMLLLK